MEPRSWSLLKQNLDGGPNCSANVNHEVSDQLHNVCIISLCLVSSYKWDFFWPIGATFFETGIGNSISTGSLTAVPCISNAKYVERHYRYITASRVNYCEFMLSMNPSVLTASDDSQYRKSTSHTSGNEEEISISTTTPFRAECMSDVLSTIFASLKQFVYK